MYDYLGIKTYVAQSHADDEGVNLVQLDVVAGNPMVNFTPVKDSYGGLWYADAYEITDDAQGIYTLGPTDYVYSDYFGGVLMEKGDAKIFTLSYETARMDAASNAEIFYDDVMDYFAGFYGVGVEEFTSDPAGNPVIYPNPATDHITVKWDMAYNSDVEIQVYSITGQLVHVKHLANQPEGNHEYRFSTYENGMIQGLYILKINSEERDYTHELIIK